MKKILIAFFILLILFTILIFVFIPGKIVLTGSKVVGTTSGGLDSCLHKLEKWEQWWPGTNHKEDSLFIHEGYKYKLSAVYTDGGSVQVASGNLLLQARIQTIPKNRDSITAAWTMTLPTGNDPFTRLSRYLASRGLKKSMHEIHDSLCRFAEKTENIYGFGIERTTFTEITLLAYRFKSNSYPSTAVIYDAVNKIRQYIINQDGKEKYYPMMNTRQVDSTQYETMVALSIEKMIPANETYFISQMMLMKDRFLTTEVTGGQITIRKAYAAIEKYMKDHSLSAPARPFEILVTDRSKEPDTAKWKTKIFFPSM